MAATTLFPVASLPACVTGCGVLFDVNGACVPPAKPTAGVEVYGNCFCDDPKLAPFKTGTAGVCDAACAATPGAGSSIQSWFTSFCGNLPQTQQTSSSTHTPGSGKSGNGNGGGGTWLEGHYQWVIFLVIMVVAIVGIWVGACIWRRKYLRKKDRQYALGRSLAHQTSSGRVVPNESNAGSVHVPSAGMFEPAPLSAAGVYDDQEKPKKGKKKWRVTERT